MAFNWPTFRTRTLTAAVFVAVMLTGLLWNHWSFLILFSIIHFGCWWEYLKLTEKIHTTAIHIHTKLGLMLAGYGLMLWFCGPSYHIGNYGLKDNFSLSVSGAGFLLMIIGIFRGTVVNLKAFGMAMLGLVYISLCWGLMISLWQSEFRWCQVYNIDTIRIPVILVLCLWINDTMAYIVGTLIGKTPLSKISPKKTWEGTIGGILLAVITAALAFPAIYNHLLYKPMMILCGSIALIATVTGTIGDLFESKLKRMAGVKDSGSIMPGHGGFLDRFDSLLLAIPAVWLFIKLVMK